MNQLINKPATQAAGAGAGAQILEYLNNGIKSPSNIIRIRIHAISPVRI